MSWVTEVDPQPPPSPRAHRLRRMSGRDPSEQHRVATPLELLFDLTFVVSTSVSSLIREQLAHAHPNHAALIEASRDRFRDKQLSAAVRGNPEPAIAPPAHRRSADSRVAGIALAAARVAADPEDVFVVSAGGDVRRWSSSSSTCRLERLPHRARGPAELWTQGAAVEAVSAARLGVWADHV
jgi:hypothetical protein